MAEGHVLGAPVVPNDNVIVLPVVDVLKFGLQGVFDQLLNQRIALDLGQTEDGLDVQRAEVENPLSRFRVNPQQRMGDRRKVWNVFERGADQQGLWSVRSEDHTS